MVIYWSPWGILLTDCMHRELRGQFSYRPDQYTLANTDTVPCRTLSSCHHSIMFFAWPASEKAFVVLKQSSAISDSRHTMACGNSLYGCALWHKRLHYNSVGANSSLQDCNSPVATGSLPSTIFLPLPPHKPKIAIMHHPRFSGRSGPQPLVFVCVFKCVCHKVTAIVLLSCGNRVGTPASCLSLPSTSIVISLNHTRTRTHTHARTHTHTHTHTHRPSPSLSIWQTEKKDTSCRNIRTHRGLCYACIPEQGAQCSHTTHNMKYNTLRGQKKRPRLQIKLKIEQRIYIICQACLCNCDRAQMYMLEKEHFHPKWKLSLTNGDRVAEQINETSDPLGLCEQGWRERGREEPAESERESGCVCCHTLNICAYMCELWHVSLSDCPLCVCSWLALSFWPLASPTATICAASQMGRVCVCTKCLSLWRVWDICLGELAKEDHQGLF